MTDTQEKPAFRYAYGRATARDVNFSVMARRVDIVRTIDRSRWQFSGPVQNAFDSVAGADRGQQVMGSYHIGWAIPVERDIVHFRVQTVRTGYAARIAEVAIVLDIRGPRFELLADIPTTTEFPHSEIMVFSGRGWTMNPEMLAEFGLEELLNFNDEELFWNGKEDEISYPDDSGILSYTEQSAAIMDRPNVILGKDREGKTTAALVSSVRRRRRIKVRK